MKKITVFFPLIIVLVGLMVNGAMLVKYYDAHRVLTHDESQYDLISQALLKGESSFRFTAEDRDHDIGEMMLPGYSFLLALIFMVVGHSYLAVYLFQILASIVAAVLVYKIMKRHVSPWLAFISSLWIVAYYPLWNGSFMLMRESIVASTLMIAFYLLDKYFENEDTHQANRYFYWCSIVMGLLICISNRFILHYVFFMAFMFYQALRKRFKWQVFIMSGVIVFAILLPWHIRQYIAFDRFILFGPIYTEGTAKGDSSRPFLTYQEARDEVLQGGHNTKGKAYFEKHFTPQRYEQMKQNYHAFSGFEKYKSRFMGFWEVYTHDIRFGFGGDTRIAVPSGAARKYFNLFLFAPMILFFLIGFIYSIIKQNHIFIIIGLFIIAHVLLHTLVHYIPRYRTTIIPLIFILGWYGIAQLIETIKNKTNTQNK